MERHRSEYVDVAARCVQARERGKEAQRINLARGERAKSAQDTGVVCERARGGAFDFEYREALHGERRRAGARIAFRRGAAALCEPAYFRLKYTRNVICVTTPCSHITLDRSPRADALHVRVVRPRGTRGSPHATHTRAHIAQASARSRM